MLANDADPAAMQYGNRATRHAAVSGPAQETFVFFVRFVVKNLAGAEDHDGLAGDADQAALFQVFEHPAGHLP